MMAVTVIHHNIYILESKVYNLHSVYLFLSATNPCTCEPLVPAVQEIQSCVTSPARDFGSSGRKESFVVSRIDHLTCSGLR